MRFTDDEKNVLRAAGFLVFLVAISVLPAVLLAHGQIDEQIEELTRRIEAANAADRGGLHLRRGDLHRIHRDFRKANADYDRARELGGGHRVDLRLGTLWLEAGEAKRARTCLDRFLALEVGSVKAYVARARALSELGEHLAAAEDYRRAIALFKGPKKPLPDYFLGLARELVAADPRNAEAALEAIDRGVASLGGLITLHLLAVDIELARHHHQAALARLDRVLEQTRRQERWLARRGEILEQAGRNVEAVKAYEQALTAIASLPPGRRRTRMVTRLERRIAVAIERLRGTFFHAGTDSRTHEEIDREP
jgi:tetratricopeptide (TPR) repeat protein